MNKKIPFRLNKSGWLGACIAGVMAGPYIAGAQDAEVMEEIVVEASYRAALMKARDLKRDAVGARDSIVAEDIADFPDLNLAESLQRIPGVAITREGGEGRQISLRGLGPDFTSVELNGMQVLGTTSSPMDSRGAVSRSRAFDFNIFASELFSRIDVHKSFSAELDEGGIGGTVGLYTAKPFDKEGFNSAVTGQLGSNEFADDTSPRVAALISNTWGDTFGALASIAYSKRETVERGYNTFRWRQRTTSNFNPGLDLATQRLLRGVELDEAGDPITVIDENGDEVPIAIPDAERLWFGRGNRYTVWENEQERLGITTAFQFRPSENLSIDVDILYGELNNSRKEWHLPTAGASSTALGFVEDLQIVNNNGDNEVVLGEFSDVTLRTESRRDEADTTFEQFVVSGEWVLSDRIVVTGLIGTEKAEFDQPVSDKVYFQTPEALNVSIVTDYRDRFDPSNSYDFDTTDAGFWEVRELDFREDFISNEFDNIELDVAFDINDSSTLKSGVSFKNFENSGWQRQNNDFVRNQSTPQNDGVITIGDYAFVYNDHPDADWLAANVTAAQAFYGLSGNLTAADNRSGTVFTIEEETLAAYAQYEWSRDFLGRSLRGNVGVRYYDTEITSEGELAQGPVDITQNYDGVLPALNLAWDLTDEIVWRASLSENLSRPSLSDLSVAGTVDPNTDINPDPRVNAGNPALDPFESLNFETSIEWYFDEIGFVALGFFYKDIENFIITETQEVPYGETGFPLELLLPGQDANTLFQFTRPVNTDDTTIKGFELSFQRDFDFLPEPFNRLGVIANWTIADGETLYRNVQNSGLDQKKNFPGLSEDSGNLTFYYEADNWGARIATAYRSEYISRVEGGLGDEDERGFHATTNVDFSAFYQLNDQLKLTFEGINLTDEPEEQYSDSSDRPYNITNSGSTYYIGASYKF